MNSAERAEAGGRGGPSPPPLAGVTVLDLTNVLAGPFASYQLALMGANVIKVEVPGEGDLARRLGADPELSAARLGASFLAQNAGKRSLTLDLKHPAGKEVFARLVRQADVLVENFRPGVLARLGFPWSRLEELNPRLVYCAISGFGQTGPLRDRPAYDQIVQGLAGIMAVTGTPETAPLRVGFPVCDTIGGWAAAFAVTAALVRRERTGRGACLDVSMLETAVSAMGWVVSDYLIAGREPRPHGNENPTAAPSGAFRTADGMLNIAANKQEQFETLCRILHREDLLTDARFRRREDRKRHRDELRAELEQELARRPAADWEEILSAAGVPAARVLTVPQALGLEQLQARSFIQEVPFPVTSGPIGEDGSAPARSRPLRVVSNGIQVDGAPRHANAAPPRLGQHSEEVLSEFGFASEEIETLRREGVI